MDSNVKDGEKTYDVTVKLTASGAEKIAKKGDTADVTLEMTATLS